jgi:threonine aldolase
VTRAPVIDLRSDTVTAPSDGMRKAMHDAEVGDDVYGEDPSVIALEERVAALLGHEAGLFTVTGSLANMLGIRSLVPHGGELLCESRAHVVRAELGAHAVFAGATTRTWAHPKGHVDFAALDVLLEPNAGPYFVSTSAVAVENTHNFAGGTVQPLDSLVKLCRRVDGTGVGLHLDGARLWNAHVASGVPLDAYGRLFDTVSVCFSKGLGAPIGSLLVGSAERIAAARVWRKRLGAGWRQAGVLSAAASYALDNHVARLADDHANALAIAELVADAAPNVVDPADVETNIVVLDLGGRGVGAGELVAGLKERGVLAGAVGTRYVRLVTHLDVTSADCRAAGETIARLLAGG